ncbi:hypothetical protein ACT80S_07140 [Ramlibacter sp. MAHUQ-53]|uniref:hypothetical protein n=1 Tax=unclassified Ramlibacter TaxID=2617605 RepID=UPI0036298565
MTNPAAWFLRLSVLYLLVGVGLGLHMAASHDHSMHPVHAHLNLLGWVTMALFGLYYRLVPEAGRSVLAKVHFWVYVPAHFVMMVMLWTLFTGRPQVEPLLAGASIVVALGCAVFAVVVWRFPLLHKN